MTTELWLSTSIERTETSVIPLGEIAVGNVFFDRHVQPQEILEKLLVNDHV
jgi:hypothetical protein